MSGELEALRPLGTTELLDEALRLYRRNFRPLFVVALVINAPLYATTALFQGWYLGRLRQLQDPAFARALAESPEQALSFLALFLGGAFAFGLIYPLFYQWLLASLTAAVGRAFHDEPVAPAATLREVLPRLPALFFTHLLQLAAIGAGAGLAAIPGFLLALLGGRAVFAGLALAAFSSLAATLVLGLRWLLLGEVMVLERTWGLSALRRAAALMEGRVAPGPFGGQKLRASLVLLLSWMVSSALAFTAMLPRLALELAFDASPFSPGADPSALPLGLLLPVQAFELCVQTALFPFLVATTVRLYFDTRIRREGLDLELAATRRLREPA